MELITLTLYRKSFVAALSVNGPPKASKSLLALGSRFNPNADRSCPSARALRSASVIRMIPSKPRRPYSLLMAVPGAPSGPPPDEDDFVIPTPELPPDSDEAS